MWGVKTTLQTVGTWLESLCPISRDTKNPQRDGDVGCDDTDRRCEWDTKKKQKNNTSTASAVSKAAWQRLRAPLPRFNCRVYQESRKTRGHMIGWRQAGLTQQNNSLFFLPGFLMNERHRRLQFCSFQHDFSDLITIRKYVNADCFNGWTTSRKYQIPMKMALYGFPSIRAIWLFFFNFLFGLKTSFPSCQTCQFAS